MFTNCQGSKGKKRPLWGCAYDKRHRSSTAKTPSRLRCVRQSIQMASVSPPNQVCCGSKNEPAFGGGGGGVALLRASQHLKGLRTKNDDQKTGVEIVRKALSWPARQIAINAGEDGSVIIGKILEDKHYAYGFDSQTGEYSDLIKKGIIDPTKVVRVAIQNAASVAALLITTEAMVAEVPKKDGGGTPAGGGMGGMGF